MNCDFVNKEIYLKEIIGQMPRILGNLCRVPSMKNYGCFDRQFWNYNICDTPCARKQETVLTLALLYKIENKLNPYFKNDMILDWIKAALSFWGNIQLSNGAFNDLYPNEYSFVATAFSSYAISECLLLLENELIDKDALITKLKKSADWLLYKHQEQVLNQEAGSAIALYNIFLLTKDDKYKKSAQDKINFIFDKQNEEGWFPEYGGADIGYLSVAIDYLAKYYQKTKDTTVFQILCKAADFIEYFLHPDYTYGGEYGSRNTEYLLPHGFEILAKEYDKAKAIANHIRVGIEKKTAVSPFSLDDKYLLFYSYVYLQAYLDADDFNKSSDLCLPYQTKCSKNFSKSGIWIFSNDNFYLIANYKKGGALKAFFKQNGKSIDDSGILILNKNNKKITSFWISDINDVYISNSEIVISGYFWNVFDNILTPFKNVVWRIIQITFGKSEFFNMKFKEFLRKAIITKNEKLKSKFIRRIYIGDEKLFIEDKFDKLNGISMIITSSKLSFTYGESARYFQVSELNNSFLSYNDNEIDKISSDNMITIKRVYDQNGTIIKND